MHKIIFSKKSIRNIEGFVDYLEDYYERFYSDTWIADEAIIRAMYRKNTRSLFDEIKNEIISNIQRWIFGNILAENDEYQELKLVIFVRSYIWVIELKKFKNQDLVAIETIIVRWGR